MKAHSPANVLLSIVMVLTASVQATAQVHDEDPLDSGPITLALPHADIRDALHLVAEQGGVNLVMSKDVVGTIDLVLDKPVTLREALDAIVKVGGFQYTIEGNIVIVSTLTELLEQNSQRDQFEASEVAEAAAMEVLVLELRYVDAERVMSVVEKLVGEGGSASLLKTSDHIAKENAGRGGGSQDTPELQIGSQLSTSSQGQPAKSHTLVVVDVPKRLERIREVVEKVDVRPVQIVIEARFVEVTLGNANKLGIDWNLVARASGAAAPHTFPFGDSTLGEYNPNVDGGSPGGVFPSAPDSVASAATSGLFTFGTLDFSSFAAILEMIRTDSHVQVVSNPRVVVGDRHTATILVGERYPILSANVSEFGSVTEELDHYEPIGVQLEVTPSVLNDDEIELFVRPSTSSLGPLVVGSTGLAVARINSRQIDTMVTVKDSQTLVLGGLITSRETDETSRVPFLGRIPLLGKLFTHESKSKERVDLVVFLTVAIVQEHGLTADQRAMFENTSFRGEGFLDPLQARTSLEFSSSDPQY